MTNSMELICYINEDANIEFLFMDDVSYQVMNKLIKAGFRRQQVRDPDTDVIKMALVRDLQPTEGAQQ